MRTLLSLLALALLFGGCGDDGGNVADAAQEGPPADFLPIEGPITRPVHDSQVHPDLAPDIAVEAGGPDASVADAAAE